MTDAAPVPASDDVVMAGYDAVVDVRSMATDVWSESGGIKIYLDPKQFDARTGVPDQLIEKNKLIVSFAGPINVGKTHAMARLTGSQAAEGDTVNTLGISMFQTAYATFLDSAGRATAACLAQGGAVGPGLVSTAEEAALDKKLTDRFIRDFLLHNSDILIYVVNRVTNDVQTTLESYHKERCTGEAAAGAPNSYKLIICLHNLQVVTNQAQLFQYIKIDMESKFPDAHETKFHGIPTWTTHGAHDKAVVHFFIGREQARGKSFTYADAERGVRGDYNEMVFRVLNEYLISKRSLMGKSERNFTRILQDQIAATFPKYYDYPDHPNTPEVELRKITTTAAAVAGRPTPVWQLVPRGINLAALRYRRGIKVTEDGVHTLVPSFRVREYRSYFKLDVDRAVGAVVEVRVNPVNNSELTLRVRRDPRGGAPLLDRIETGEYTRTITLPAAVNADPRSFAPDERDENAPLVTFKLAKLEPMPPRPAPAAQQPQRAARPEVDATPPRYEEHTVAN